MGLKSAWAQDTPHAEGAEQDDEASVFVQGARAGAPAYSSASQSSSNGGELRLRPRRRAADLLEATPGLFAVQHAGGGKANQYFLRGFDIDHGTDLLITVDGVPVNMPSHGHGQGYADLNFIIPELVARLDASKGPYWAQFGDFATAGAVGFQLASALPESQVAARWGQFGVARGLAIVSKPLSDETSVVLAGELYAQNGPFENPEKLSRMNAFARVTHDLTPQLESSLTWMSYSGSWNASGQIPEREVEAGRLDRFGSIDPSEGGATQRHGATLRLKGQYENLELDASLYGILYDWRLYSNFTFYLDDPLHGDQIEQTDKRGVLGSQFQVTMRNELSWVALTTTAGLQVRFDSIENGLYHDVQRERLATTAQARIAQSSIGLYVQELARFTPWLAMQGGLRVDRMQVDVQDRHAPTDAASGSTVEGAAAQQLASPKLSLILSPLGWLDMFVNVGRGFHSNDARGATRRDAPADLLVPAMGYEWGSRVRPLPGLAISGTLFRLDLKSEQVYVGDAGTTEPSAATSRYGVEFFAKWQWRNWLAVDAALTLNRAEYRANEGNAGAVALAPTRTLSAGVSAKAPFGMFGSLRVRHVGPRPATEDGRIEAQAWTQASASLGQRIGPVEARLDVDNLFNSAWREVQFATTSRLRSEVAPVEEIHFAPGWPLTVQGTVTAYF